MVCGRGLLKVLRARFGKKLVKQRCAIHKSRNLQRHLAKPYRNEAHRQLTTALEQTSNDEARRMLLELEAWFRTKNETAAESLLEAFDELLTLHRFKVAALLRKTLLSTNPIESMFSLVRHREHNPMRTRGSAMLQQWLGSVLLYCECQFKKVTGNGMVMGKGRVAGAAIREVLELLLDPVETFRRLRKKIVSSP